MPEQLTGKDKTSVMESIWHRPRPAVAFEEDQSWNPCKGHIVGEEVVGSLSRRFSLRLIFEPSEDITRRGTDEPTWRCRERKYVPARLVRFTDKVGDGMDSAV